MPKMAQSMESADSYAPLRPVVSELRWGGESPAFRGAVREEHPWWMMYSSISLVTTT